jgi:hypothetical protein
MLRLRDSWLFSEERKRDTIIMADEKFSQAAR